MSIVLPPHPPNSGEPADVVIDHAVAALVAERNITEILHFTTAPGGLVGICATGAVRSRDRLDEDKYIEHIYAPNCANRLKDAEWTDFVNLSISRVNKYMLDKSEEWHPPETGIWWAVLSFDPTILTHPGVHFTTTNNVYTETVVRGAGREGLEGLFADSLLWGHYGSRVSRWAGMPPHFTTDKQAEVLYPREVPLKYLRAVYVAQEEQLDEVKTWIEILSDQLEVDVAHRPDVFA